MYIEASNPNNPNKRANLLSPHIDISALNNPTLQFWYHLYDGANDISGDLLADVYNEGFWYNIFSISGNQGNSWYVVTIDVDSYKSGSVQRIRFRGVTGETWSSDIAIDDFEVRSEAFHTYPVNNIDNFMFDNTNVSIQFTSGNSNEVTLIVVENLSDPGIFGSLPGSVVNVSPERCWNVNLNSGTVSSNYNMTIDLDGIKGVYDYSTLFLLKRDDNNNPWVIAGTNAYIGSGTEVTWTGITSGFSEFAIGGAGDNSLPVTLTLFNAVNSENGIILNWTTENEIENLGFILERKTKTDVDWQILTDHTTNDALKGKGNTSSKSDYSYLDENVVSDNQYQYRIADVSYTGVTTYSETIKIAYTNDYLPKNFTLNNAYPNPFNPVTSIRYGLPEESEVNITIFDINGRKVKKLINSNQEAGWYNLQWNGTMNKTTR